MNSTTRTAGRARVPGLDSVRGIAIGLVMLRHAWPGVFGAGGFSGVELFFVLSGFLITGILLADQRAGNVSYRRFYANRVLRLYPALVVMLIATNIVVLTINPLDDKHGLAGGTVVGLIYLSDIPWIHRFPAYGHLWTLSIEEQFYLLWPVLLLAFAARGRRTLQGFAWLVLAISVLSLLGTIAVADLEDHNISRAYMLPTTWACTLMVGCLMATGNIRMRPPPAICSAALAGLLAISFIPNVKVHSWGFVIVLPVIAVLGMIVTANAASEDPLSVLLNPSLQKLGRISYAAYLWNYPLSLWVNGSLSIPLSIVAAAISYPLVERPFLRRRLSAPHNRATS